MLSWVEHEKKFYNLGDSISFNFTGSWSCHAAAVSLFVLQPSADYIISTFLTTDFHFESFWK